MHGVKLPQTQKQFSDQPLKKIKVAIVVDSWFPFVGGAQIHIQALKQQFDQDGRVEYKIYAPRQTALWYRLIWTLLVPIQIAIDHISVKFDLIHSHGFHSGLSGKISSILTGRPVIHTVHGSHLLDKQAKGLMARLEAWLLLSIKYSAMITVARDFRHYQPKTSQVFHLTNGVNLDSFNQQKPIQQPGFTVLFIGRNHPDKGIDVLEKAFARINDASIKLNKIVNGNLTDTQLVQAYKSADVFVLPSRAEGQPITILEAWAAQLPVVATPVGENRHMIKHKHNGLLIPVGDNKALAEAIQMLNRDRHLARKLGKTGWQLVKDKYQWSDIADQTYEIYKRICGFYS